MSLIAATLYGQAPQLYGKKRTYRVEEYRDKKSNIPPVPELTEEVKKAISPASYEHMIGLKVANINAIIACMRNGINTQPAIQKATGISQGTVCMRLSEMIVGGEVAIDKNTKPWCYYMA